MDSIIKKNLKAFKARIQESKEKQRRIVDNYQWHYHVFDWADDSTMAVVDENVTQYLEDNRYSVTPFTEEQQRKQIGYCKEILKEYEESSNG